SSATFGWLFFYTQSYVYFLHKL
ncbi:hypothetical protein A5844_000657, partial [Enterococcus sp. 10A9_DIV0425]